MHIQLGLHDKISSRHICNHNGYTVICLSLIVLVQILSKSLASTFPFPLNVPRNKTVDYSRSVQGLIDLASADLKIAEILTKNVHKLPYKAYLRRASEIYLEDLQTGSGLKNLNTLTQDTAVTIAKNPIASYRAIRRMVKLLPDLSWHAYDIFQIPGKEAAKYLHRGLPNQEDLDQAMDAILRLHLTYDFDIKEFADGKISGVLTGAKLDAVHCYEIGVYGMNSKEYYAQAIDWLDLALNKITIDGDKGIDKGIVSPAFASAAQEASWTDFHDEAVTKSENSVTQPYFFDTLILPMIQDGTRMFSTRRTQRSVSYEVNKGQKDLNKIFYNYYALCGGETFQSLEEKSELFCWLEFKAHPYFFIGPMKMEFLARSPDVVQVLEMVGEQLIDTIKANVTESMSSSYVVGKVRENYGPQRSRIRTSENTWVRDSNPKFLSLSQRVGLLTGLNTLENIASEETQVAAYTSSGHYDPHLDAQVPTEIQKNRSGKAWGDRISTFLIYLSDVEAGGYTAFPNIGVAVKPTKGTAIFWYNVFPSEQVDFLTSHAACPVLLGHKYIANKWIHYNDQFLTHKCTPDPKDQFRVAVNQKHIPASRVVRSPSINTHVISISGGLGFNSTRYSYRSIRGLKALAVTEQKIYKIVKLAYLKLNENVTSAIETDAAFKENHLCVQNYLKDFEDSTGKLGRRNAGSGHHGSTTDFEILPPETIAWNPIASYRMVWRTDKFFKKWMNETKQKWSGSYGKTLQTVKGIYKYTGSPNANDLADAKGALLTLQHVYDLSANDMASGNLVGGKSVGITLTGLQCYELGMEALSFNMFAPGIEWLEAALLKVKITTDSSIARDTIEKALRRAITTHDKQHLASQGWEPWFYDQEIDNAVYRNSVRRLTRKEVQYNAFRLRDEPEFANINFNGICAGKPHLSPEEQSKLFCYYETKIHPYWKINPLKAEFHSLRPKLEVVQYYDILSDKIMDRLKENVTKINDQSLVFENAHVSGSVTSWVLENQSEDALRVSKLIERVTGLTVQNKDKHGFLDFQLRAYVPGGSQAVHMDVTPTVHHGGTRDERGATFMFYLSDVELGGSTAFAQSGANIVPRKGSGIFWYNLYSSGQPNPHTFHGACPVVMGEKWVASKTVSYLGQKKHVCDTTKSTVSEVLVNGMSKYL